MKTNSTRNNKIQLNLLLIFFAFSSFFSFGQTRYAVSGTNDVVTPNDLNNSVGNTSEQTEFNLTVNFSNMTPHVGEDFHLRVYNKNTMEVIQTVDTVAEVNFTIDVFGITNGMSYNVDFYADHNGNGMYDAPPTDHAWRLELNDVKGDTTLNFMHNINFTDIMWKNKLTVSFTGMSPHLGEDFQFKVYDKNSFVEIQTINTVITDVDFTLDVFGIKNGRSYNIDFYADHNKNGQYDPPPTDHAWRLVLNDVMGDTTLYFDHNINFTDISITTGISGNYDAILKLFPNPAHEKVFIETGDFSSSDVQVKIYDISAKLKLSEIYSSNKRIEINIEKLERGIYFVELNGNGKRRMMKLIKD